MGTPDFTVPTLRAMAEHHEIAAVYSQPPRAGGRRGLKLAPSPVHRAAEEFGIEVRTPVSLRDEPEQEAFRALGVDVAVVVAYGLILPRTILDSPRAGQGGHGCLNGHASLLPRWRGAAPIQRAIMAGDAETGVCVMGMEAGLDTGPVAIRKAVPITPQTTAGDLHDRLAGLTAELMVEALALMETGDLAFTPQPEDGVTYAAKIEKGETRIDWSRRAAEVHAQVMGLSPAPGAWFAMPDGERVKVLRSAPAVGSGAPGTVLEGGILACGEQALAPLTVQRAGKRPIEYAEMLRGRPLPPGTVLG